MLDSSLQTAIGERPRSSAVAKDMNSFNELLEETCYCTTNIFMWLVAYGKQKRFAVLVRIEPSSCCRQAHAVKKATGKPALLFNVAMPHQLHSKRSRALTSDKNRDRSTTGESAKVLIFRFGSTHWM